MADVFFYGTMCHPPLRDLVLGRKVAAEPASLPDHAVYWAAGRGFPLIVAAPGARAEGVVLRGLTAEDLARLDFYEGGFGYRTRDLLVDASEPVRARVFFPDPGRWKPGAVWNLADWVARWGGIAVATARDYMALRGEKAPGAILPRYEAMLARGASRQRAEAPAPTERRRANVPGDIAVARQRQPYAHFFAVEEYDLAFRRFDGSLSPVVNRAVFISGDAATVLPYDPVRDRVLVIEQFRAGPMARGDSQPWHLEPIAGRVDPGETPEDCARREAVEEAGLTLQALLPVANYYPTPGAKSEFLYSFVALTDLPDEAAGVFGVEGEAEDIRGHLLSFDELMRLVQSGEIATAPLILTAFWLARERDRLRAGR